MSINKKIILHIDMNSYFASVEQQANPFLRGRSVGVCAYLSPNGTIIASSAEAKSKGIKTGCRVSDAIILDPGIVLLENEPSKYRSTTERIFSLLSEYTDRLEPYSIDEAFLDLTGWVKNFNEAEGLAQVMQSRIKDEIGDYLGSSVGISWTKFLSKFAGDMAPKKSILAIENEEKLIDLIKNCFLRDVWGINVKTENRLRGIGINSVLDLKNYDKNKIKRSMGRYGYYLWANLNGEEITQINHGTPLPKSVGHSYCIPKKTSDKKYLKEIFYKLCEKTGRRIRDMNMEAQNISINIGFVVGGGICKSFKTPEKMFTTEEIFSYVSNFLENVNLPTSARLLSVSVSRLSPVSGQLNFFDDNISIKELSRAMDKINNKYGEYTVIRGQMFGTDDMARDRVGFRKTISV